MRFQMLSKRFALLGLGVAVLLALVARRRNGTAAAIFSPPDALDFSLHTDNSLEEAVLQPSSSLQRRKPLLFTPLPEGEGRGVRDKHRRRAFAAIFLIALVAPMFLPHQVSGILFIAFVTGSLAVGVHSSPQIKDELRQIKIDVRYPFARSWQYLRRRVTHAAPVLSFVFAWGAVVLMIVSAYYFLPKWGIETLDNGARYTLVGGIALSAALLFARAQQQLPQLALGVLTPARSHKLITLLGVFGLAFLAEISGNLLGTELSTTVSHHVQLVLLCASLALVTWGISGARPSLAPLLNVDWHNRGVVLGITLLAFILRWWQLGEAIHFFVDEVNFTSAVMYFDYEFNAPLLSPFSGLTAFPWLYPYLQAGTVDLFGHNLLGLRAVSAIFGTLTIPALYLLAKALFDRKTALLAALLLAVFPPHIHFSRLGINNIADPLFGTMALAFLARGLTTNRRLDYAIGGVSLGLTQYFYEGGRLLYPPLVLAWLALGAFLWRDRLHGHGRGIALAWIAALIVAAPIYYNLVAVDAPAASRMSEAGLNTDYWRDLLAGNADAHAIEAHLARVRYTFAMYVHLREGSLFYGGDNPLLLAWLVPTFLLGTFFAVWRLRSPGGLLLILWILLTSLGNSLLVDSTHSTRYVVVFPALALLVAVGVRYMWRLLALHRLPQRARYGVAGALVLLFTVGQVVYYFGPHLDSYRFDYWFSRSTADGQDAAFRAANFPRGTEVHIVTRDTHWTLNDDVAILSFLSNGVHMDAMISGEITDESLDALARYRDHAFFIEPSDQPTLRLLREHFTLEGPYYSPWNVPMGRQFLLYYANHWQRPR